MRTANQNKTFSVLAAAVDDALNDYRDAEQQCEDAKSELRKADVNRANARTALDKAILELYEAHPELQPVQVQRPVITAGQAVAFREVEVDDPDDVPDFRETT